MTRMTRWLVGFMLLLQIAAGIRVVARMARTASGERIPTVSHQPASSGRVTVVVPVLNEESRLAPCLEGLVAQGEEVAEILVVDGGSGDGTRDIARRFAERDLRVRLIDAAPVPGGWNGKPWNLHVGARAAGDTRWLLTIDADVRPGPALVPSLLAHAERTGLRVLSMATPQLVSGRAEAPVHTSLLTTLVYRYGIPGHATGDPQAVQANGQCFLISRNLLAEVGGFASVARSVVEDVTLARHCAAAGERVGFHEPEDGRALVTVAMYGSWYDALVNWTRSLPMRDRYAGPATWLRLADATLAMALPPLLLASAANRGFPLRRAVLRVNAGLIVARLGTQAGIRRAYTSMPPTHWLAPLLDPITVTAIVAQSLRRQHRWRGRAVLVDRSDTDTDPALSNRSDHAADARILG